MSDLMDQMVIREKVPCQIADQFAEAEFGIGEDDGFLYLSIKFTDEEYGAIHLNLDLSIGSSEDDVVHNNIPNQLRRLADALEKNNAAVRSA